MDTYPWAQTTIVLAVRGYQEMTIVLICPQCRNEKAYDNSELDTSKEIACSRCGFSGLPTSFELTKQDENKSWLFAKIVIIILIGIVFVFTWLYVITLAAFSLIILVPVIAVLAYRSWKEKQAKG